MRACLGQSRLRVYRPGARPRWATSAHAKYPAAFRHQVTTLLLCAARLGMEQPEPQLLGKLPREVLLLLIETLAERNLSGSSWTVSPVPFPVP